MSDFKKLDDLPKGRPNTYAEVMKAMAVLHKGVMKQAALYGGKNSKLYIPHVVETSLLKSVNGLSAEDLYEDDEEVARLLDITSDAAEKLSDHLKSKDDEEGLKLLGILLRRLGAATGANTDEK